MLQNHNKFKSMTFHKRANFFINTIVLDIKIIYKITFSSPFPGEYFHPYPLFQWYPQSKEIEISNMKY